MTDAILDQSARAQRQDAAVARLKRRYAAERRFRFYGIAAILSAIGMLLVLLTSIVSTGLSAFWTHYIAIDVTFDPQEITPSGDRSSAALGGANYAALLRAGLAKEFPEATSRQDRRLLSGLLSNGADLVVRRMVLEDPSLLGQTRRVWVKASDDIDLLLKGSVSREAAESNRRVTDREIGWVDALAKQGKVERRFDVDFFTSTDSREPELAGIWGALKGSLYLLAVTLALSFPVGVLAAVYLEEFAPKNRWTDLIEVNINNLAAVPSIVFGLLGLAVFLGFFNLPRSSPLVGGMVLALMNLPIIIIAGRAALKSVPPSIRQGALAIGASPLQVVTHHVLPLAMPGILTGTIIGMAHALGETAPLLMIGMVAFIVDAPDGFLSPATALPVQIFIWADSPERAFLAKTSAAIMVLLVFLILMNALAVILRRRFERRW